MQWCRVWYESKEVELGIQDEKCGVKQLRKKTDLGATVTETLAPTKYVNRITGELFKLLEKIRTAVTYLEEEMMRKIITTLTQSKLEYEAVVWSPYIGKYIRKLDTVLRAATKRIVHEIWDIFELWRD